MNETSGLRRFVGVNLLWGFKSKNTKNGKNLTENLIF